MSILPWYFFKTERDIVVYQKRRCPNGFRVNASSFTGKENIALNLSKTKTQPENLSGVSAMWYHCQVISCVYPNKVSLIYKRALLVKRALS